MSRTEVVLEATGLCKNYRSRGRGARNARDVVRPALVDVSITLRRGDVLGLVGESGSGKTTLARCLTLLERPDAGRVVLDDIELTAMRGRRLRDARRRIQTVFQNPYASLNPRLTVGATLTEVLRVHRLVPPNRVPARIAELLDLVGLPMDSADRFPREFSGGQRQRVCIARALAAEPDVLIADEAVSSLDVSIQAQTLNLLSRLREELDLTVLFISHDLHVVRRIAPTIAVMFGGRIVEVLPPGLPLEASLHPYTQALIAALPRLEVRTPDVVKGADLSTALPVDGCPFRERCPHAFGPCTEVDPPLEPTSAGHLAACHYVASASSSANAAVNTP